jgi:hypothetical protein
VIFGWPGERIYNIFLALKPVAFLATFKDFGTGGFGDFVALGP